MLPVELNVQATFERVLLVRQQLCEEQTASSQTRFERFVQWHTPSRCTWQKYRTPTASGDIPQTKPPAENHSSDGFCRNTERNTQATRSSLCVCYSVVLR